MTGTALRAQSEYTGKNRKNPLGPLEFPHIISYQGMLSSQGIMVRDGAHVLTFRLYTDSVAQNAIWTGTYDAQTYNGVFSVLLGSDGYPLPPSSLMDQPLWLGVQVDGATELRPLTMLTSSPYALNVADNSITSGKIAAGAVTPDKLPSNILTTLLPDTTGQADQFLQVLPGGGYGWGSVPSGGTVTSVNVSGGTTGLTTWGGPVTSKGIITLQGTLAVSNGGTGQTSTDGLLNTLVPDSTHQMTKLLGIKPGGGYGWIDNGATVTNSTNTPDVLLGSMNDYTIDAASTYIRLSNSSGTAINLTGLDHTGIANGRTITLVNTSANAIVIEHQSGASSSNNQFDLPGESNIILGKRGMATFIYDQTAGFWELVSTN